MSYSRKENQKSIAQWAEEEFGPAPDSMRIATRANEEMSELLSAISTGGIEKCVYEAADVVIIFYRLAEVLGADLDFVIDKKMEINRQRQWERDGTGHGYHRKHISQS